MEVKPGETRCPEDTEVTPKPAENAEKQENETTFIGNIEKSDITLNSEDEKYDENNDKKCDESTKTKIKGESIQKPSENAEKSTTDAKSTKNIEKSAVTSNSEDEKYDENNDKKCKETTKTKIKCESIQKPSENAEKSTTDTTSMKNIEKSAITSNSEDEKYDENNDKKCDESTKTNIKGESIQKPSENAEKSTTDATSTRNVEKSAIILNSEDEKHDETDEKKCEEPEKETATQNSFKKPALLIGPRRGKVGQLRVVPGANAKEEAKTSEQNLNVQSEKLTSEENVRNDSEAEKSKIGAPKKQQIPLQYKEPAWGGLPSAEYKIEVLKSGVILHTIDIHEKSFYVIGRLPTCDISLAHPTISRYHAILQYRAVEDEKRSKGFFLYDLGSTHGTFWNGNRVWPNTYVKVQGGHMIRFGGSQRKFILQAPPDDVEEESELSVTELKEKRRLDLLERERAEREAKEKAEEMERLRLEKEEQDGINWGMGEDADEETDLTENPYALTNNEELFLDDPKKTLRGWFEREGHDLQYETEEKGIGQFLCWVDLPLDTATGRAVRAEALVKGKKKEAVIQCALEACRILDRHGVLRQATHEARKRKTRNWEEEDFYDSDEDNFLDRTGTVEKKREQRMRQAGKLEEKVETYASLLEKHTAVTKKIVEIENKLKKSQKRKDAAMDNSNEDALDAFMSSLNSTILNKAEVTKMKLELQSLRKEEERLLKLVNMTKPANLPSLTSQKSSDDIPKAEKTASSKQNSDVSRKRKSDADSDIGAAKKTLSIPKENPREEKIEEENSKPTEKSDDDSEAVNKKQPKVSVEERIKKVEALTAASPANVETLMDVAVEEPKDVEGNTEETEKSESEIVKKKKRNVRRIQQRADKAAKETQKGYEDETYSEDYSMWLPPVNQSGDGKTNLNDKYGY